ncbi:MAG: hypothetical protein ACLGIB_00695 [Actinomycetota bacterium]
MKKVLIAVSSLMVLALTASAALAEYAPKLSFKVSDTKTLANPEINILVSQEQGEEELGHVTLNIPKGFNLPADEAIENGDVLGTADLEIAVGPACRNDGAGAIPLQATVPFSDRKIVEQDRTDEQADAGVHAVWVVDLKPVTTIPLEVTGSVAKGWKLDGDIPANDNTCPPLVFDGTIFSKSEGGVPLVTNPKKPGKYVFSGSLFSAESPSVVTVKQPVTITK